MAAEVVGDTSGRSWQYDPVGDKLEHGQRWRAGAADDGSLAMVHACHKGGYWDDELERSIRAVGIATRPEIRSASYLRQLLDVRDTLDDVGEYGYPEFVTIWEWGDVSLEDFLSEPDDDLWEVAEAVRVNVTQALRVLHGLRLVHLDVAPNNILRVAGVWKLADLDSCVRSGALARRHPIDRRWVHQDRREDPVRVRARREFDWYGLEQVLRALGR